MKKVFTLATAAMLITGISFAHGGDGKKCAKAKDCGKDCSKKEMKDCCSKKAADKKDVKTATVAPKAAATKTAARS